VQGRRRLLFASNRVGVSYSMLMSRKRLSGIDDGDAGMTAERQQMFAIAGDDRVGLRDHRGNDWGSISGRLPVLREHLRFDAGVLEDGAVGWNMKSSGKRMCLICSFRRLVVEP
jgi:hypothetical protein